MGLTEAELCALSHTVASHVLARGRPSLVVQPSLHTNAQPAAAIKKASFPSWLSALVAAAAIYGVSQTKFSDRSGSRQLLSVPLWNESTKDAFALPLTYVVVTSQSYATSLSAAAPAPPALEAAHAARENATQVAPLEAAPVEATPVEAAPDEATPVEAAPVEAKPVEDTRPRCPADTVRWTSCVWAARAAKEALLEATPVGAAVEATPVGAAVEAAPFIEVPVPSAAGPLVLPAAPPSLVWQVPAASGMTLSLMSRKGATSEEEEDELFLGVLPPTGVRLHPLASHLCISVLRDGLSSSDGEDAAHACLSAGDTVEYAKRAPGAPAFVLRGALPGVSYQLQAAVADMRGALHRVGGSVQAAGATATPKPRRRPLTSPLLSKRGVSAPELVLEVMWSSEGAV
jgi:hypothetical protein